MLATLCVALAMVFAGASAASVLDRVQHDAQLQHEHRLHLGFSDDDHHDRAADAHDQYVGDHEDRGADPNAGDHQPGLGHHHHGDAPSGALDEVDGALPLLVAVDARLIAGASASAEGVRPGGLKRPPRTTDRLD